MALRGTLEDLGIVEVVQLPQRGRRTCLLWLDNGRHEARLFFNSGELVHAEGNGQVGLEVLVDLMDWQSGEFELTLGAQTTERSIELDLHRAVMLALQKRDERKREEEMLQETASHDGYDPEAQRRFIDRALMAFVSESSIDIYVCVLDDAGDLVAEAMSRGSSPPPRRMELSIFLSEVLRSYPGGRPHRALFEDAGSIVALSSLGGELALVVVADQGVPVGAVSRSASKLSDELARTGTPQ